MPKIAKSLFDPKLFLAKVGEGKTILKFDKNQTVFAQGDVADTVFYIQKGRIKVLVVSEQGKEAVVGILETGQFFGEGCLNGHPLRISTTTAMEECLVTSIEKVAMLSHHWVCDSSRTRQDLGWEPEVRFPDGLKITAQWYEENGWL